MTPERWQRIGGILSAAWKLAPGDRDEFVEAACQGDPELTADVQALLDSDQQAREFLSGRAVAESDSTGSLPPGCVAGGQVGPYRIVSEIGGGGMGTVYLAERADGQFRKRVAIKFVNCANDDIVRRFLNERQMLADLEHPNIARLLDGGTATDGRPYIVMEYVEGETLRERIARGPISVNDALAIAGQIAVALDAAHEKGIIHRDVKPANIKITADGTVRVLDFGIAKIMSAPASERSTTTNPELTSAGVAVGTLGYMSPEQARAEAVDKRSDIWAFGVVLFEMLCGHKPFWGESPGEIIGAVLTREPDFALVPVRVHRLLSACLEKNPRERLRDIGDWRRMLDQTPAEVRPVSRPWAWAAATLGFALLAIWAIWRGVGPSPELPLVALDLELGEEASNLALSLDGSRVAYVSHGQLAVRRLDDPRIVTLAGTDGAAFPFFSPDGQWLGFFAGGRMLKILVGGGAPSTICAAPDGRGGSWGTDGYIVAALSRTGGLSRVAASGGTPQTVTRIDGETPGTTSHRRPHILPGNRAVVYTAYTPEVRGSALRVLNLDGGTSRTLVQNAFDGRYLSAGFLIYYQGGTVFGVSFDLKRLETSGAAIPLAQNVAFNTIEGAAFDVSRSGLMTYRPGAAGTDHLVSWLSPSATNVTVLPDSGAYWTPRLSYDGTRLAMFVEPLVNNASRRGIWIFDLSRQRMARLTFDPGLQDYPVWTPDGEFLAFRSAGRLATARSDGTGKVELAASSRENAIPWSFSENGQWLAFSQDDPQTGADLWAAPVDRAPGSLRLGDPQPILRQPANQYAPAISPDQRWVAYHSDESGRPEVYIVPFSPGKPASGGKWQISSAGGSWPIWSRTSPTLFFRSQERRVMAVGYETRGDSFEAEIPHQWAAGILADVGTFSSFDIARDGSRAVGLFNPKTNTRFSVMLHVNEELRRRHLTNGR